MTDSIQCKVDAILLLAINDDEKLRAIYESSKNIFLYGDNRNVDSLGAISLIFRIEEIALKEGLISKAFVNIEFYEMNFASLQSINLIRELLNRLALT